MRIGPNHRHTSARTYSWRYSGEGYNRVRVCDCGAEDHDPDGQSIDELVRIVNDECARLMRGYLNKEAKP